MRRDWGRMGETRGIGGWWRGKHGSWAEREPTPGIAGAVWPRSSNRANPSVPFERSSHGLLGSNRATPRVKPEGRLRDLPAAPSLSKSRKRVGRWGRARSPSPLGPVGGAGTGSISPSGGESRSGRVPGRRAAAISGTRRRDPARFTRKHLDPRDQPTILAGCMLDAPSAMQVMDMSVGKGANCQKVRHFGGAFDEYQGV